jgi:hypothetical protein
MVSLRQPCCLLAALKIGLTNSRVCLDAIPSDVAQTKKGGPA